jgi:hypothetical protein
LDFLPFIGNSQVSSIAKTKAMRLQLQNMTAVSCEVAFNEIELLPNCTKKDVMTCELVSVVPDSVILRPFSFINFSIQFITHGSKYDRLQFPVTLKYSARSSFVTVTGVDIESQFVFHQSARVFLPIQPFLVDHSNSSPVNIHPITHLTFILDDLISTC